MSSKRGKISSTDSNNGKEANPKKVKNIMKKGGGRVRNSNTKKISKMSRAEREQIEEYGQLHEDMMGNGNNDHSNDNDNGNDNDDR